MGERLSRFHCRVYPANRRPEVGTPVVVLAGSRRDAVDRAIELGWGGRPEDARVSIDSVEDVEASRA